MNQATKQAVITLVKRFARAFVAGGIASLTTIFAANQFNVESLKDPRNLLFTLVVAFVSGGLQAIDKMIRYQDAPQE